jgi:hypothetical protein
MRRLKRKLLLPASSIRVIPTFDLRKWSLGKEKKIENFILSEPKKTYFGTSKFTGLKKPSVLDTLTDS